MARVKNKRDDDIFSVWNYSFQPAWSAMKILR